jgi:hypothetical protein
LRSTSTKASEPLAASRERTAIASSAAPSTKTLLPSRLTTTSIPPSRPSKPATPSRRFSTKLSRPVTASRAKTATESSMLDDT